jgi:trimeric autotransporter adhesin
VPRLYAFANLVYSLRADDAARYSFLSSSRIEQLQLVASQCPHFAPLLQQELDAAAAATAAAAASAAASAAAAAEREAAETAAAVAAVATAEAAAGATSASAGTSGDAAAAAVLPRTPEPLRRTLSKQRSVAAAAPATPGSSRSSVCIVSPPRGSAHNAVKSPRKGKGKGRAAATPQKKSPQKCVTDYFAVVSSKATATGAGSSTANISNSAGAASAGEQEAVVLAQELALEAFLSAREEASKAAAAAAAAAQADRC